MRIVTLHSSKNRILAPRPFKAHQKNHQGMPIIRGTINHAETSKELNPGNAHHNKQPNRESAECTPHQSLTPRSIVHYCARVCMTNASANARFVPATEMAINRDRNVSGLSHALPVVWLIVDVDGFGWKLFLSAELG